MPNESGMEYGGHYDFAQDKSVPSSSGCSTSEKMTTFDAFCQSLDAIDDKQKRIDMIDDAIHRLQFERRWQLLTPEQVKHMCDESLSDAESQALASANNKKHKELVTMYARARYFRRCAWLCYLNGESSEAPLAASS